MDEIIIILIVVIVSVVVCIVSVVLTFIFTKNNCPKQPIVSAPEPQEPSKVSEIFEGMFTQAPIFK